MMVCENEYIHIIELSDAQNGTLADIRLKDEMDVVTGMFAVAYVPVEGAVGLNGFKEEGQFRPAMVSVTFSNCETTYAVPLVFQCLQGFVPTEEHNFNHSKQILFKPLPVYKNIMPNTSVRVKYRDSVSDYRFKHHIKLLLTYKDK
jgi:hypothetical protein